MSRIRGIETKIQELQPHKNGFNENGDQERTNEDQSSSKEDLEIAQMRSLSRRLPALGSLFSLVRKVGEGTFSCVYLATLRRQARLPPDKRRLFALKHLVPTAHPARVEHELRCLQEMGGSNNVIGVELCLRHLDNIVFVMPYIPHKKFSEYVGLMDAEELRQYMVSLLRALRHVHSFGVIHRDVKPSNFLYDRDNRRYLLVDFGLAQRVGPPPAPAPALAAPPPAHANSALKRTRDEDAGPAAGAKRVALDLSLGARPTAVPVAAAAAPAPTPVVPHTPKSPVMRPPLSAVPGLSTCTCAGVGGVCGECAARAPPRAPRAGTQGFRPPEVLLKYPQQTCAVDVWAAGVVLLSAVCARYPLLRAPDDARALAELCDLLGTQRMRRAAHAMGRRLVTSTPRRGLCLRKLCARMRGLAPASAAAPSGAACARCRLTRADCLCPDDDTPGGACVPGRAVAGFPDSAFSLAAQLLEPDPRRRLTADQALQHPFLADPLGAQADADGDGPARL